MQQLLHPSAQEALDSLVDRLNSPYEFDAQHGGTDPKQKIKCLLLCTADGVSLARSFGKRVYSTSNGSMNMNGLSEQTVRYLESIIATFPALASTQLRALSEEGVKTVTAFYSDLILVHVYASPLVLTFVGGSAANVGAVKGALPSLLEAIGPLRKALVAAQTQGQEHDHDPMPVGYGGEQMMGQY